MPLHPGGRPRATAAGRPPVGRAPHYLETFLRFLAGGRKLQSQSPGPVPVVDITEEPALERMTDDLPTARNTLPKDAWLCLFVWCKACFHRGPGPAGDHRCWPGRQAAERSALPLRQVRQPAHRSRDDGEGRVGVQPGATRRASSAAALCFPPAVLCHDRLGREGGAPDGRRDEAEAEGSERAIPVHDFPGYGRKYAPRR